MKNVIVTLLFAALAANPGLAATKHSKTATLTVHAPVTAVCSLATTSFTFTIGIGYIHSPGNTILRENLLNVACTKGASTQISMNTGLYGNAAGAKFGSRSMKDPYGDFLGYDLCHDSACAAVWKPSGYTYVSPGANGSSLPVWTRIITGQPQVKQGNYSDAVTVTINF